MAMDTTANRKNQYYSKKIIHQAPPLGRTGFDFVRTHSPNSSISGHSSIALSSITFTKHDRNNLPSGYSRYLEDYSQKCSDAVDEALSDWPIIARSAGGAGGNNNDSHNATVRTGFVGDNVLRSTLWRQSFEVIAKKQDQDNRTSSLGSIHESSTFSVTENEQDDTKQPLYKDDLLDALQSIFSSPDLATHASEWDQTFVNASVVDCGAKDRLVHWTFQASPLAKRDMLYVIHEDRQEITTRPSNVRQSALTSACARTSSLSNSSSIGSSVYDTELQITYAYASIRDEWVRQKGLVHPASLADTKKRRKGLVRAFNCFPSCDRVTVFRHRKRQGKRHSGNEETTYTITVDHLMTTNVGGWIGKNVYNHCFKKALIQANLHEAEAMRNYILKLCREKQELETQEQFFSSHSRNSA